MYLFYGSKWVVSRLTLPVNSSQPTHWSFASDIVKGESTGLPLHVTCWSCVIQKTVSFTQRGQRYRTSHEGSMHELPQWIQYWERVVQYSSFFTHLQRDVQFVFEYIVGKWGGSTCRFFWWLCHHSHWAWAPWRLLIRAIGIQQVHDQCLSGVVSVA